MPEKYPDIKQHEKCPTEENYVKIYGVKERKVELAPSNNLRKSQYILIIATHLFFLFHQL